MDWRIEFTRNAGKAGRKLDKGVAEEFYPDEHPQILEREVGYIFPLMEVEPTICIELKNEEDEG